MQETVSSIRKNTQELTQNQWEMREDSTPPFLRMQDNTQPTLNLPRLTHPPDVPNVVYRLPSLIQPTAVVSPAPLGVTPKVR